MNFSVFFGIGLRKKVEGKLSQSQREKKNRIELSKKYSLKIIFLSDHRFGKWGEESFQELLKKLMLNSFN